MTTAIEVSSAPRTAIDLFRSSTATLAGIMHDGHPPPFEELVGWEFNGLNVGFGAGLIGIRKFRKGFYEGPARTAKGPEPFVQGYNIPIRRSAVGQPHVAKPTDEAPKRFGFYRVYPSKENPRCQRFPRALLLDYGLGGNGFTVPALLRDYLVQVHRGSSDLMLGWASFLLGPLTIPGGFFILERTRKHDFKG
jgi:hypothetical protein